MDMTITGTYFGQSDVFGNETVDLAGVSLHL